MSRCKKTVSVKISVIFALLVLGGLSRFGFCAEWNDTAEAINAAGKTKIVGFDKIEIIEEKGIFKKGNVVATGEFISAGASGRVYAVSVKGRADLPKVAFKLMYSHQLIRDGNKEAREYGTQKKALEDSAIDYIEYSKAKKYRTSISEKPLTFEGPNIIMPLQDMSLEKLLTAKISDVDPILKEYFMVENLGEQLTVGMNNIVKELRDWDASGTNTALRDLKPGNFLIKKEGSGSKATIKIVLSDAQELDGKTGGSVEDLFHSFSRVKSDETIVTFSIKGSQGTMTFDNFRATCP